MPSKPSVSPAKDVSLLDGLIHEYLQAVDEKRPIDRSAMLQAHPELASELAGFFEDQDRIAKFAQQMRLEETVALGGEGSSAGNSSKTSAAGPLSSIRYFGRYEILEEIARGGMGVVYKARQSRLDRIVALKMILAGQLASEGDVARFYSEAQSAANLEHSGIVPIYEVGQYGGQHYFSMAYIEGESLAARLARGPLPEREAVKLVQQLCQAVEYAHERGVIHRDIKPANVLIDAGGRPRITDFGLAKQTGSDSGLTATGQVLGTPSFMPPEQACGNLAAVGKSADIYALGAVLYAAVTGRPPFQAPTPIETLLQVRELDPPPPRVLNPAVSRDLETICLKCLEKDPQRRYATAAEMAEDLRRLLADEPILARRQSPLTQGARWLRKRRAAVLLVLASTAAAVAIVVGAISFSRSREQAQLGKLQLRTSGQTLVAEVLDAKDQPAAPSFPVPNTQPIELPQGNYQARLSSPGMISETYTVDIEAGKYQSGDVRLENRFLWPPLEIKNGDFVEPIPLPSGAAGLLWRRHTGLGGLRLVGGVKGDSLWPADLQFDDSNVPPGENSNYWPNNIPQQPGAVSVISQVDPPLLLIASRQAPVLIAVAIKTGKIVWTHHGQPALPAGSPDFAKLKQTGFQQSPVIGKPLVALGPDKKPIVVCAYMVAGGRYETEQHQTIDMGRQQIWVEALGATSGAALWRHLMPAGTRDYDAWEWDPVSREALQQPQLATIDSRDVVVAVHGAKLVGVELASGKEAWPTHDLGFEPDVAPKVIADSSPSKAPLALFASGRPKSAGGWSGASIKNTLTALALADFSPRWQTTIDAIPPTSWPHPDPTDLPQFELIDLAPGKPMMVCPTWQPNPAQTNEGATALTVIDPQTGKTAWQRPLVWSQPFRATYFQWIVGPDLDGDGQREIFAAWTGNNHGVITLVVAAFSGRDGHTLWRWTRPNIVDDVHSPHALCFWDAAASGFPKLVVPIGGASGQSASYVLDSADGRLLETLPEVSDPRTADLDGDGLPDLYYTVSPQGYPRLMTVRGAPPTAWRRLNDGTMYPLGDLDGDGVADAVVSRGADEVAISGKTGQVLWESDRIGAASGRPAAMPHLATGRPNGSQATVDLLVSGRAWTGDGLVVQRLDGRTGRNLWPEQTPAVAAKNGMVGGTQWFQTIGDHAMQYPGAGPCFLNPDKPDVWAAAANPSGAATSPVNVTDTSYAWLYILSGADGSIRWKAPIAVGCFATPGETLRDFKDLDGDGVADVVAWGPGDKPGAGLQLVAYNGADGKPLWPGAAPVILPALQDNFFQLPTVADLDGEGKPDIVFARHQPGAPQPPTGGSPMEVVAVSGKTGKIKWTWSWVSGSYGGLQAPLYVLALHGAGPRFVTLSIMELVTTKNGVTYQPEIVVLDHTGKPVVKKTDFKPSFSGLVTNQPITNWWRKVDLRGDGHEQLTYLDDSALVAFEGEKLDPVWRWPLATPDSRLSDLAPAADGKPTTVAIWDSTSMYGVSGATGKALWRGEMTSSPVNMWPNPDSPPLLWSRDGERPRLLASDACRLTWPTSDTGRYLPATGSPRAYEPVADPVFLRPLPWAESDRGWQMLLSAVVATVVLLIVPSLLLRQAIRRNSWALAFVPAFYQMAMALIASAIPLDAMRPLNEFGSYNVNSGRVEFDARITVIVVSVVMLIVNAVWRLRRRLWVLYDATAIYAIAIALAWPKVDVGGEFSRHFHEFIAVFCCGGAIVAAVWLPIRWLSRQQFGRFITFVVVSLILSVGEAALTLMTNRPSTPDEPYSYDGWYWVIPVGFIFAAGAVLVFSALRSAAGWLWRAAKWAVRRQPPGGRIGL